MDVDQPAPTSHHQQPSSSRPAPPEHFLVPTSATTPSFESHDTEADEVDALIGVLSDAPPSPLASSLAAPEKPALPPASTRGESSSSGAAAAARSAVSLSTPASISSAPAPAPNPAGEERISFASLQPSTKGSLLDRINLSNVPRPTSAPPPPPSPPSTTPADDLPYDTTPVTAANLPSLLSRISAFMPFARPGVSPSPSLAADAADTLTPEQSPAPPATARSSDKPQSTSTTSQPTAPAGTSVPLAHRIEYLGLAALAESLPKKPQTGLTSPTPSTAPSSAAVPRDKDKLEHERQGLRQERKMSEAARTKRDEADRARVQREEEAKRYLAAKTEQARKASAGSVAALAAGVGARDADPGSLRGRNFEADAEIDRRLMYDPPPGREVERYDLRSLAPPSLRAA